MGVRRPGLQASSSAVAQSLRLQEGQGPEIRGWSSQPSPSLCPPSAPPPATQPPRRLPRQPCLSSDSPTEQTNLRSPN